MDRVKETLSKILKKIWQWKILLIITGLIIWAAYSVILNGGTGFGEYTDPNGEYYRAKTFWDLLELLVVPIALAILAYFFSKSERENDQAIALDRVRESNLQNYFDKMTELLLKGDLRQEQNEGKVGESKAIARARTLTVLRTLDKYRKAQLLQFLNEANLIASEKYIIDLRGADLSGVNLSWVDLSGINLNSTNLRGANLGWADLNRAVLFDANLCEADLRGIDLGLAELTGVDLREADLCEAVLNKANLRGANLGLASLREADLSEANLIGANLIGADLSGADLSEANLLRADLRGANLSGANLRVAKVTDEQLLQAKSLKGATRPDGTKHD